MVPVGVGCVGCGVGQYQIGLVANKALDARTCGCNQLQGSLVSSCAQLAVLRSPALFCGCFVLSRDVPCGACGLLLQELREELLGTVTGMASTGLRTLCLAYTGEQLVPGADSHRFLPGSGNSTRATQQSQWDGECQL